ncbi:hypothetical protein OIU76_025022 [Salix suchowensis]|uniref:Uncharacterized protein n=2 Tax=Salix TaxID=40685 RepID=A0A9Q0UPC9_9ROSI|nr:hypothetical protein OIU76_025022 [Salix suchowensis]KAJ6366244.1 hypothetical protein OIU77_002763 [Salix suchowensis]KAJ6378057.1 hypothetical protein OIU78_028312 [Salix suchowensis]KAJ6733638.1 hypothetical protein OIU74_005424 [Salix koriyanagi]
MGLGSLTIKENTMHFPLFSRCSQSRQIQYFLGPTVQICKPSNTLLPTIQIILIPASLKESITAFTFPWYF